MRALSPTDWQCAICSYFNARGYTVCDMCDAPSELDPAALTERGRPLNEQRQRVSSDDDGADVGCRREEAREAVEPMPETERARHEAHARERARASADAAARDRVDASRYGSANGFAWSERIHELNRSTFGHEAFRGQQLCAINAALDGRDTVVLLPTGAGKSLAYQLPALARPGMTLVVGPLIALANDQVEALTRRGVDARVLSSHCPRALNDATLAAIESAHPPRLLFVTPERLAHSTSLLRRLKSLHARELLQRIAVDEAHCIALYGHDFRPEYLQLGQLREALPGVPWTALTATATAAVLAEICERLQLREPVVLRAPLDRENIRYEVQPKGADSLDLLAQLAREHCALSRARGPAAADGGARAASRSERSDGSAGSDGETERWQYGVDDGADDGLRARAVGIVYCFSCKEAETVADALVARGVRASFYHAQLEPEERQAAQAALREGRVQLLVATCAFGMGIDMPHVALVVHFTLPRSLDSLFQEAGRAGRAGQAARHVLLFAYADKNRLEALLRRAPRSELAGDGGDAALLRRQLDELLRVAAYALDRTRCRREALLEAYEQAPLPRARARASCCDCCAGERAAAAASTLEMRPLALVMIELVRALRAELGGGGGGGPFGGGGPSVRYVSLLAAGSRAAQILEERHDALVGYGAAAHLRQAGAVRLLHAMVVGRLLTERATPTAHGGVSTALDVGPAAAQLAADATLRFPVYLPGARDAPPRARPAARAARRVGRASREARGRARRRRPRRAARAGRRRAPASRRRRGRQQRRRWRGARRLPRLAAARQRRRGLGGGRASLHARLRAGGRAARARPPAAASAARVVARARGGRGGGGGRGGRGGGRCL